MIYFMESSINLSILIPIIPFGINSLILVLLISFNRTINRLTKPVSYLSLFSILFSFLLVLFYLLNHVDIDISLSNYLAALSGANLEIHLNDLSEKLVLAVCLFAMLTIFYSVSKLQRRSGYVRYIIIIGYITSLVISSLLLINYWSLLGNHR